MIKKIILINTIALGLISVPLSKEVLAEDDLNVINENKTESKVNVIVEGNLGEHTEEPVIPEESWMRITLPTAAVFNSTTDQKKNRISYYL